MRVAEPPIYSPSTSVRGSVVREPKPRRAGRRPDRHRWRRRPRRRSGNAAAANPPLRPSPRAQSSPFGGLRTIVIDAGHGGDEHGARGAQGTREKDVPLGVARRLKAAIESRLGGRVILTRDADATVGLDERAAVANNNKADVFLSLHVNASVRASAAGAEVFYLSLADYGAQAQRVAQGEGEALPVFGGGTRDIEVILWEMAQARHIEQSASFARLVEAALRERVPMSPRAIQQAPFRVLAAPTAGGVVERASSRIRAGKTVASRLPIVHRSGAVDRSPVRDSQACRLHSRAPPPEHAARPRRAEPVYHHGSGDCWCWLLFYGCRDGTAVAPAHRPCAGGAAPRAKITATLYTSRKKDVARRRAARSAVR